MSSVVEAVVLFLVKQIITEGVVKEAEKKLVEFLKGLAAKTDNRVDDYVVEVVAEALGVQP